MNPVSKEKIHTFQQEVFNWYKENKRDFPWRHTHDPYKILVSEIMSQQTQISRVVERYEAWLDRFPTVQSLAEASLAEVIRMWSGLGYNRRALYLHNCAKTVVREYDGVFPQTVTALQKLPGIGPYTSAAIACFAFMQDVYVIDTNIKKVIAVEFFNGLVPPKQVLEETAAALLPEGRSYEWNQALMDYAAIVLKDKKITTPKQSPFKNSDRYYRGQILKRLSTTHILALHDLEKLWDGKVTKERQERILEGLIRDGLVVMDKDTVSLPS